MKKSLSELASSNTKPEAKRVGAFKNIEGDQATIDLEMLRKHNIFFATPCYGGVLTDQFFLSMFKSKNSHISESLKKYQ